MSASLLSLTTVPASGEDAESSSPGRQASDWFTYGGSPGGTRYSPLRAITRANVDDLEIAWTYRTGDVSDGTATGATTAFEATPILAFGTLFLCTPYNRVIGLDPGTGEERWAYDPAIDLSAHYANQLTCRGVAAWADPQGWGAEPCTRRIFTATNDVRLVALDADTGQPCRDFGTSGQIDLSQDVGDVLWKGEHQVTSAPVVIDDLVVVGSAISDNWRLDAPSGAVRAYDARTGSQRWTWDPVPPGEKQGDSSLKSGTANVWAPMSVDPERGLVFVPTGNTSPDFFGGLRDGLDLYSSSVVALRGSTGEVVWHFQTVHHDLWDYDVPAQPILATLQGEGTPPVHAVAQATKMGHIFVLDRETGKPIFPVVERPVPQGAAPGEHLSPTQPFPTRPPPLIPQRLGPEDAWGLTPWDRNWCRKKLEGLRSEGIFTPPSIEGSIIYPGVAGGTNWGSAAFEPDRGVLLVNATNLAHIVRLIPRAEFESVRAASPDHDIRPQAGTPYGVFREAFLSPIGIPCNRPPWGTLAAIDLRSGEIAWQVPLGTTRDIAPIPISFGWGVPNLGGPIVTAGGLVFIAAAMDDYLRAFDVETGAELWKARLPAGGQATPMTYRAPATGRQYVVIAAGGHGRLGTRLGDYVVAFAVPSQAVAQEEQR